MVESLYARKEKKGRKLYLLSISKQHNCIAFTAAKESGTSVQVARKANNSNYAVKVNATNVTNCNLIFALLHRIQPLQSLITFES